MTQKNAEWVSLSFIKTRKKIEKFKPLMWLFLFGSIWGINEVFLGEILYRNEAPYPAVILTVIALFLLAISSGAINKPGSSTLIGIFAVLFRLAMLPLPIVICSASAF
jgi:hypothetical protein